MLAGSSSTVRVDHVKPIGSGYEVQLECSSEGIAVSHSTIQFVAHDEHFLVVGKRNGNVLQVVGKGNLPPAILCAPPPIVVRRIDTTRPLLHVFEQYRPVDALRHAGGSATLLNRMTSADRPLCSNDGQQLMPLDVSRV